MQLKAPAKINLSFEIKARRPDGFHEIETLMAPLSLADQIHLETDRTFQGVQFSCDDSSLPDDENNLVVRAARNFQRKTGSRVGLKITLQKNIPHGAGLGGGSSDAATTLLGLNKLLGAELAQSELVKLAAEIGSDVPFFLFGSAAICEGRGEFVKPSPLTRHFTILLLKPDFGVPTPWAYKGWSSSRELPGVDYATQEFSGIRFMNDLERPVFEKFIFLAHFKQWLRVQPEVGAALLSGSGSTLFAVIRDGADAEELAERVRAEVDPHLWTHICATV